MTRKKKRPRPSSRKAGLHYSSAHARRPSRQTAFTLVELLLTLVLLLLLASAVVFNFGALRQGADLNDGADRLETFIRFAKVQAAESGCKVQLYFAEATTNESSSIQVLSETQPLAQPGVWVPLPGGAWDTRRINETIRIVSVRNSSVLESIPETSNSATDTAPLAQDRPPIIFHPDGTCDSAEIILAARDPKDTRRLALHINGYTGALSRRSLAENADINAAAANPAAPATSDQSTPPGSVSDEQSLP